MKKSCSFCREPGGTDSMFPVYGLRPHRHRFVTIGGAKVLMRFSLPSFGKGFVPEYPRDSDSMGVHYCKRCGAGRPKGHLRHQQMNRARLSMKRYRRRKARKEARG